MTMTPEQLLENFKTQQAQTIEEIRKLDVELTQKKEFYVKLQGAIEGLSLLNPEETEEKSEEDLQMETVALSN
jgi:hypothetical protein